VAGDLPTLGLRIRQERQRRGISLRALAREVGVSASMISQIETGKSRPSVSTLYAITSALKMPLEEAFAPADPEPGSHAAGATGPLVHPEERAVLRLDSGVTWERLGELPGQTVDFLLVTYAPGATSSSGGDLMRHTGAEYGYLLRGELVLTLGFEEVRLRAGDAISFESTTPHGYRNDGADPAVGVWFVIENCLPHP
jgi:transcriptional regulator with XRE-family HTH domain